MRLKIILTILATAVGIITMAQNDLKFKLDSIANSGIENGIPGIQLLISDNNQVSIFNYGYQDIEKTKEINDSTNWRYGSITKIFTTVIILQLESEGKLSIEDSVSKYLNLNRHNESGITIKHLLNHTSGLYNYVNKIPEKLNSRKWNLTKEECVQISLNRKTEFEPGNRPSYCNTGFTLLGLIIEKVTGESVKNNFQKRIFSPCELYSMIYCEDEKTPQNTARGYVKKRKKYNDFTQVHHGWANTAGAILGTASDLLKFNECLFSGKLIDSIQLNKMINPTVIFRDIDASGLEWFFDAYGLGWHLTLDTLSQTTHVSHGGNTIGYNCNIQYEIENNLTIVIGMNLYPNHDYEPVFSTQNQLINTIHEYYKKEK